ncbi:axotactin-like isoform X3 [Scylla paramamosain]|uniref:axotactin-like isoform X3 n=1 Tax=Scylla paramamosain TaxID=85552 RepID=UPI0030837E7C
MRLLQVVLAVGLLAHLAVAWPLFDGYDDEYDYSGDYIYDYNDNENTAAETGLETVPETAPEEHHHHNHHHHGAPPDTPTEMEGSGDAEDDTEVDIPPELLPENLVPEDGSDSIEEVVSEEVNGSPEAKGGPSGVVAHGVVPTFKMPKSCSQPPDPGVCRGYFPMFYFDPVTRTCLQFVYGGCRGNSNAFHTAKACYEKCHPVGFTRGAGKNKAGSYLKLHDGKGDEEFTFPGRDAALKVEDATLAEFSVRNVYQLEFFFRTDSPHGLIAFLRQTSVPSELGNKMVQLYVFLRRGHLAVTHIFCHHRETFLMRKGGLQGGNWHSALVKVNSGTGQLLLEVDGVQEAFTITSLKDKPHFGSREGAAFTSRLWIGGVFEEEVREEKMVGRTENFHGCLKKIALMSGTASEEMVWHKGLSSSAYRGVRNICRTNCNDRHRNLCSQNSHCIEHFDHSTCNCFGSGMDGRRCNNPDVPILSLSNDGYVVHRLYEWMDRVHTYTNFISLEFRTRFTDSILFYGSAEYPEKQYIVASLTAAGTVYVEANLGGGAVGVEVGNKLETGTWHSLILVHQHNRIQVHLNSRLYDTLIVPGEVRYFHLDPAFYIGGAPNLTRTCGLEPDRGIQQGYECQKSHIRYYYDVHDGNCHILNYSGCGGNGNNFRSHQACMDTCNKLPGLRSMHSFLGCMRNVFINDVSVLWELKVQNKTTRYHGATEVSPLTDTCKDREQMVLLTLSTERAHVNLTNKDQENFRLAVSFRPTTPKGVVASGYVDVVDTSSQWEIYYDENHVSFVIHEELMQVKPSAKIVINNWQYVEVKYSSGKVVMRVNHKTVSNKPPGPLTFFPVITFGLSPRSDLPGMVGCLRKVELGTEKVELRSLAGTNVAQKDVIYDGCRVLGPCDRPGSCEHGTTCTLDANDEIQCDCADSGYTGKTCHFSLYKTSCEEYHQIGYNKSGVFRIDVDGNGPLPPSFVKCNFNSLTGVTNTIVENNLPEKYEVRGPGLGNLQVDIKYRDFSDEMFQALIEKSESCSQNIRYDCRRSPLKLSTHTWFSSPSEKYIASFGSKVPGLCRCKEIGACDKADVACNCDAVDGLARSDIAVITQPDLMPLTSMVFLEDKKGMREESEGRITLGPLICATKATKEQTVSFSKNHVYLEVPAWREGSLAFSFKTTSSSAMLAYQPAYHPSHATFRIALLGEKEVEFMYSYHGLEHRHSLHTARRLNTGQWQQVLIDIYHHQLRFLINSEQKLIDIEEDANVGVLDGSMFLGGMPPRQDTWLNQENQEEEALGSLKGCIRDLTVNNELVDLDRYIRAAPLGVSASCQPSCSPNPCQNGAECIENWGSYECVCKNPLAHSGVNCENNLNEEAITFTTEKSKLTYFVNDTDNSRSQELANMTSLLLNFRTHVRQGLILFTYDYLHNFLQLHLASPNELVLYFNSGRRALALTVETSFAVPLNEGQSVQVAVERDGSTTNLTVYTNGVFFNASLGSGLLPLHEGDYEQFPYGESTPLLDMVYYPHSFTKPGYFSMFYMGSANDPQADVRSDLPGLVGCVRGFQINEVPVVLHRYLADHPAEGVKKGCSMVCDHHPCLNGGVCEEDFLYPSNFHCDCSSTSYTGPVCSTETAYTFHGSEWLGRDATTSPLMENLVFELAFSASIRRPLPQLVALLRGTTTATHDDYILVAVEPNGAVTVQAVLKNLEDATLIARVSPDEGINAFSGHRHFVKAEWLSDGLWVKVDREERLLRREATSYRLELEAFPRSLYLGGMEEGVDSRFVDYENFHGCISNVMISNPNGKFFPLQEYEENDRHITNFGIPTSGSCSGFPLMPALVMTYRADKDISPVQGEDWAVHAAQRTAYDAPPPLTKAERNTPMDNVVPAVATSVLLVSGIILAILCIRTSDKKKKAKKKEQMKKEEEEREQLLKDRKKSREEAMRARITNISEVEMKPLKTAQNGGTQEQDKVRKMNAANQQQVAPPTEPPPPIPTKKPEEEEEEVQVRMPKDSTADRPLSWDKSADALPLIGTEVPQVRPQGEATEDSTSEGSSFDCTIEITGGSPSSSAVFPQQRDLVMADSPSSMRVNRGSNTMLYVDDDTASESEPRLLLHGSLPTEEQGEVVEPPFVATTVHLLGGGEVQKITKSEFEDEIVVVDDYLEDKATPVPEADSIEVGEVPESSKDIQGDEEKDTEQQKESDLAEAAQETNQADSEVTKTDQESKPATDGTENEAGKETASKDEGATKKTEVEKENESAEKPDSDDEFIELRPENEKVQNAERVTMQPN